MHQTFGRSYYTGFSARNLSLAKLALGKGIILVHAIYQRLKPWVRSLHRGSLHMFRSYLSSSSATIGGEGGCSVALRSDGLTMVHWAILLGENVNVTVIVRPSSPLCGLSPNVVYVRIESISYFINIRDIDLEGPWLHQCFVSVNVILHRDYTYSIHIQCPSTEHQSSSSARHTSARYGLKNTWRFQLP